MQTTSTESRYWKAAVPFLVTAKKRKDDNMTTDKIYASVRLPVNLYKKMVYIAKMNYRSFSSEMNQIVKKCIREYETEHGEILLSESEKNYYRK